MARAAAEEAGSATRHHHASEALLVKEKLLRRMSATPSLALVSGCNTLLYGCSRDLIMSFQ